MAVLFVGIVGTPLGALDVNIPPIVGLVAIWVDIESAPSPYSHTLGCNMRNPYNVYPRSLMQLFTI